MFINCSQKFRSNIERVMHFKLHYTKIISNDIFIVSIFIHQKNVKMHWYKEKICVAERSFDLRTSGLWAQHASTAPLCFTFRWIFNFLKDFHIFHRNPFNNNWCHLKYWEHVLSLFALFFNLCFFIKQYNFENWNQKLF